MAQSALEDFARMRMLKQQASRQIVLHGAALQSQDAQDFPPLHTATPQA